MFTAKYVLRPVVTEDPLVFTSYIIVITLHLLANLSIDYCTWLAMSIRTLLELAFTHSGYTTSEVDSIVSDIPLDVRSLVDALSLYPKSDGYVCCPKCFMCYSLESYPDYCVAKQTSDSPECGRSLTQGIDRPSQRKRGRTRQPARRYLYQNLKEWTGRFVNRSDLKEHLNRDVYDTGAKDGEFLDIWDGKILRDFKGRDNLRFVRSIDGESRYVFGLNMDGFNPFGNKQAGKKVSTGAMYMVCLNLPIHLRYRVENIFLVGIIPGPHHPSLTQINYLLRPLVQDLLKFWRHGVYYTHTINNPHGCLVRCALVPVICDLLAARQLMAFGSFSSKHFCCYCGLEIDDIDNLDMSNWPSGVQSREEWVAIAERWRDADSKEQKVLFDTYGIRYTELLRLPYWDPVEFVVIDSMHSLFLTDLKHHCRSLWGMDVNVQDGDGLGGAKTAGSHQPDGVALAEAWDTVRRGREEEVDEIRPGLLKQMSLEAQLPLGGKKKKLIKQLKQMVGSFRSVESIHNQLTSNQRIELGWADENGIPAHPRPAKRKRGEDVGEEDLDRARVVFRAARTAGDFIKHLHKPVLLQFAVTLGTGLSLDFNIQTLKQMNKRELANELFNLVRKLQSTSLSISLKCTPSSAKNFVNGNPAGTSHLLSYHLCLPALLYHANLRSRASRILYRALRTSMRPI